MVFCLDFKLLETKIKQHKNSIISNINSFANLFTLKGVKICCVLFFFFLLKARTPQHL